MKFDISMDLGNPEPEIKQILEDIWFQAKREFLNVLLAGIPVISGKTKLSFSTLVYQYNADFGSMSCTSGYTYWKGFEPHEQPDVEEFWDNDVNIQVWQLIVPEDSTTLKFNMMGLTDYVRYWLKQDDAAYSGWRNSEAVDNKGHVWKQRHPQFDEPYTSRLEATNHIKQYLRLNLIFGLERASRGAIHAAWRK